MTEKEIQPIAIDGKIIDFKTKEVIEDFRMTEKRFEYTFEGIEDTLESDEEYKYTPCNKDGFQDLCVMLNDLHDENKELKKENGQLKQQLSDINGQLVMLDNCDNWDYDRMKHTVREIAEIIGYNGTINPKR